MTTTKDKYPYHTPGSLSAISTSYKSGSYSMPQGMEAYRTSFLLVFKRETGSCQLCSFRFLLLLAFSGSRVQRLGLC
jgi:hypothetical protein